MGAIYRHGGHLDLQTVTIFMNFQFPFNTRLHMKFEEIWPTVFRVEVVQRCEWTDGRTFSHSGIYWVFPLLKITQQ